MTRDDIIKWARDAGMHSAVLLHIYEGKEAALTDSEQDELRRLARFAALVAAAEREVCAQVCDPYTHGQWFAAAIRARSKE
jgi:hypothetical protein